MKLLNFITIFNFINLISGYTLTEYVYNKKTNSLVFANDHNKKVYYNKELSKCVQDSECGDYNKGCYTFNFYIFQDNETEALKKIQEEEKLKKGLKVKDRDKAKHIDIRNAGLCFYQFFCHEDINEKCISINKNETDASYSCNGSTRTVPIEYKKIIESCPKGNSKCCTHPCKTDDQCFSGKCEDNKCITNEKQPIIECELYHSTRKSEMRCNKAKYQFCNKNNECLTGNCNRKSHICEDKSDNYIYLFVAGVCQIILYSSFFIFCCYSKGVFKSIRIRRRIN